MSARQGRAIGAVGSAFGGLHRRERGAAARDRAPMRSDADRPLRDAGGRPGAGRVAAALTIGEAAARSGVSAKMIRYYESIGLLRPARRTAGNYRIYEDEALRRLRSVSPPRRGRRGSGNRVAHRHGIAGLDAQARL